MSIMDFAYYTVIAIAFIWMAQIIYTLWEYLRQ